MGSTHGEETFIVCVCVGDTAGSRGGGGKAQHPRRGETGFPKGHCYILEGTKRGPCPSPA